MELEFTHSITAFAKPHWGTLCRATALAGALSFAGSASAFLDPNFSVCALGTTDVTSCGPVDPQIVDSTGVSVGVIGNAGSGPLDPFILFVISNTAPTFYSGSTISSGTDAGKALTLSFATTQMYGQTTSVSGGVVGGLGSFTSASGNLYDFAGLDGGNASIKVTSGSFSVYEILVTDTVGQFATNDIFDLHINLTAGDLVAAWGIECDPSKTICSPSTHVYASPFTTAGLVSSSTSTSGTSFTSGSLPEPGTLALLGLGMLGLTFFRRQENRR